MIMRPITHTLALRLACRAQWLYARGLLLIALAVGTAVTLGNCHAGSFAVSPTRIELSDARSRTVVQVDNPTSDPITIQLRPMVWSQSEGKDQLRPTREILATPQIITIKPGGSQLVRIGAMRKSDPQVELTYRLLLEEIPPPAPADFKGLQVILKVSLPIFLKPVIASKEKLDATLAAGESEQLSLSLSNTGNATAYLRDLSLHPSDDPEKLLATYPSSIYVLPGQQRSVILKAGQTYPDKKFLIKAVTPSGPLQFHAISVSR